MTIERTYYEITDTIGISPTLRVYGTMSEALGVVAESPEWYSDSQDTVLHIDEEGNTYTVADALADERLEELGIAMEEYDPQVRFDATLDEV